MTPLPAAPGPVAANALGDTYSQQMRSAARLPCGTALRKGHLRHCVEQAQALYDRRARAKARTAELLGQRRSAHAHDVAGAEQAAADGVPFEAKLPSIDAELTELALQLGGLGRSLSRALASVEDARLQDGANAVEPAARRLTRAEARLAELAAETERLTAEADASRATVEWGHAPGAMCPSKVHLTGAARRHELMEGATVGDLHSRDRRLQPRPETA